MTATLPDTIEELAHRSAQVTPEQYSYLCQGINPDRVRQMQGQSHVEAWDIRRTLIRVFGFGGFNIETKKTDLIAQIEIPPDRPNGRTRWTVVYRSEVRLTIKDQHGREIAHYEDGATGDSVNQPSLGDAHDMALKTSLSQALKRCAVNLGDQFGLSLYNKGDAGAVVRRSLVSPVAQVDAPTPQDDAPVLGGELDEARGEDPQDQPAPAPQSYQNGARQAARSQLAAAGSGVPARAMAYAIRASECRDVDTMLAEYRLAEKEGILGVDVRKALHADLLDALQIEPARPVLLGDWLKVAGTFVKAGGGMTVAEKAKLDAEAVSA